MCLYLTQRLCTQAAMGARRNPTVNPYRRLPGGISLCSPWVDLSVSSDGTESWAWDDDYLPHGQRSRAATCALRFYKPEAFTAAPLSPCFAPPAYWAPLLGVPMFVSYGKNEVISKEITTMISTFERDGINVDVFEEPDGLHCGPLAPWSLPATYVAFAQGVKRVLAAM